MKNNDVNNKLKEIWKDGTIEFGKKDAPPFSEKSIYDAMGNIFCPGPFYFYIFDFTKLDFVYLHPNIEQVLGFSPEEISFQKIGTLIPEEDLLHIQKCEQYSGSFLFNFIPAEKIRKYKISYCYRIRTKEGKSVMILHQAIALSVDSDGRIGATLGVHSDISHLLPFNSKKVSFIGIDGEPSYMGMDPEQKTFAPPEVSNSPLTIRETEVLKFLSEGNTVKEIGKKMILSEHTVRTHRNNIRKKLNCKNTAQVIGKAIRQGLI